MKKFYYKVWWRDIKDLRKIGLDEDKIYHWIKDFKNQFVYISKDSCWGYMLDNDWSISWYEKNEFEYKGNWSLREERKKKLKKLEGV